LILNVALLLLYWWKGETMIRNVYNIKIQRIPYT
jgi:hypothetical protein